MEVCRKNAGDGGGQGHRGPSKRTSTALGRGLVDSNEAMVKEATGAADKLWLSPVTCQTGAGAGRDGASAQSLWRDRCGPNAGITRDKILHKMDWRHGRPCSTCMSGRTIFAAS